MNKLQYLIYFTVIISASAILFSACNNGGGAGETGVIDSTQHKPSETAYDNNSIVPDDTISMKDPNPEMTNTQIIEEYEKLVRELTSEYKTTGKTDGKKEERMLRLQESTLSNRKMTDQELERFDSLTDLYIKDVKAFK